MSFSFWHRATKLPSKSDWQNKVNKGWSIYSESILLNFNMEPTMSGIPLRNLFSSRGSWFPSSPLQTKHGTLRVYLFHMWTWYLAWNASSKSPKRIGHVKNRESVSKLTFLITEDDQSYTGSSHLLKGYRKFKKWKGTSEMNTKWNGRQL